jgi:tetratricopeptide (TPR) repeat protein
MIKTIHRNPVWESRQSLFESGIAVLPNNAKIHYNYANFLKDTGSIDKAISHYKKAVTLSPDHSSAHNNLATLLIDVTEVEYHLKQAIIHNPHHYKAHFNLANTLW